MSRISSRQLYDNRDILTQILDLKDEIADEKVESIAFDRSGNRVTLNMTLGDGTVKSTYFDDNFVDSITSSQVGDVVTLKFHFKNGGPTKSVSFHVSGGGGSTPTYSAGTGITRTGDASTGYTFSIDETYTAKKSDLDAAKARVTQCEADITALDGRMTTAETDIAGLASDMTTVQGDITTIQGAIGGSSTPGSIIYRLNSIEDGLLIPDTSSFTQDNSHYPTSLLVDSKKLDKPTATPTVGQLLAAGASGPEWVNPTPGAVIDTGMSDTSTNAVQNKVIKEYVDNVDDRVDAVEDEIGPETIAGTVRYDIKALEDRADTDEANITALQTGKQKVITTGTADPSGGSDGDIYIKYSATEAVLAIPKARSREEVNIDILKHKLAETDRFVVMHYEGELADADFEELKVRRKSWRLEIERLEKLIKEEEQNGQKQ